MLSEHKKNRGKADLILFTKWDRFSRNTADAYQMIGMLRKLGLEPQAIEQPLDLSVPENKMMLAFYLAVPEVENDRRALNTFHGMRRAKKEGRVMGAAPLGYINRVREDGCKYIQAIEPAASTVRWVFEEVAAGRFAADQIRKQLNRKGTKCSRSQFWRLIRNPIYFGKVQVTKYKDEEAYLADGLHEPLISESLFYRPQEVLERAQRKEVTVTKIDSPHLLPLRGFIACPECGRALTGSASKGQYSRYFYYHCVTPCKFRRRAEEMNELFTRELKKFVLHPGAAELYKTVVINTYKNLSKDTYAAHRKITADITVENEKLAKARELLLSGAIEASDYKELKKLCNQRLAQ